MTEISAPRLPWDDVDSIDLGGKPVLLCAFNVPQAVLLPMDEYLRLRGNPHAPPAKLDGEGQLVRLDAHAFALARDEAEKRKLSPGQVVSGWIRKAVDDT